MDDEVVEVGNDPKVLGETRMFSLTLKKGSQACRRASVCLPPVFRGQEGRGLAPGTVRSPPRDSACVQQEIGVMVAGSLCSDALGSVRSCCS